MRCIASVQAQRSTHSQARSFHSMRVSRSSGPMHSAYRAFRSKCVADIGAAVPLILITSIRSRTTSTVPGPSPEASGASSRHPTPSSW
eukprot:896289-Rhodomonas_salina.1